MPPTEAVVGSEVEGLTALSVRIEVDTSELVAALNRIRDAAIAALAVLNPPAEEVRDE